MSTDRRGIIDKIITTAGGTPSVDRSQRTTIHGMDPDSPEHKELTPSGMQKDYVVLSEAERRRGFVRPVRRVYVHNACQGATFMGEALAETYARDPTFYTGTYCAGCKRHFDLFMATDDGFIAQFKWDDGTGVGE